MKHLYRKREKVYASIEYAKKCNKFLSVPNDLLLKEKQYNINTPLTGVINCEVEIYNDNITNELLKCH